MHYLFRYLGVHRLCLLQRASGSQGNGETHGHSEERWCQVYRVGQRVHCVKGTKDAWGLVLALLDGAVVVRFPDVPYPDSLIRICGEYVIPFCDVINYESDG